MRFLEGLWKRGWFLYVFTFFDFFFAWNTNKLSCVEWNFRMRSLTRCCIR
jgi:hypothetical protein